MLAAHSDRGDLRERRSTVCRLKGDGVDGDDSDDRRPVAWRRESAKVTMAEYGGCQLRRAHLLLYLVTSLISRLSTPVARSHKTTDS